MVKRKMAPAIGAETCTVFVNNIPRNVTNEEVEAVFEDIGPLKKCFVVSNKNDLDAEKRIAYVTFAVKEDAEAALKTPLQLSGSKLNVKVCERRAKKVPKENGDGEKPKGLDVKEKRNLKKKWQQKKPRLIIRNLSFKVTEDDLKKECSVFGELAEVKIPTNPDGRKRGFGFIQFKDTKSAIKAIKSLNLKKIKGRPVAIDFALPKNKYQENQAQSGAAKGSPLKKIPDGDEGSEDDDSEEDEDEDKESEDDDDKDSEDDDDDVSEDDDSEEEQDEKENGRKKLKVSPAKKRQKDDSESEDETAANDTLGSKQDVVKDGDSRWFDMSSDDDDDESRDSEDDDDDDNETQDRDEEGQSEDENDDDSEDNSESENQFDKNQKPAKKTHAPNDGRTLFIRNIPFMADEESFRECMEQFGDVTYALLCLDPETDHPKGTGFVRFKKIESAQKCLESADEESEVGLVLDGRRIYASEALSKDDVKAKVKTKSQEKQSKDKRNLYLAREGLIREGSLAAKDVSKADMAKRIQLEVKKKRMLRNLHFFVSRTRLVIHNLPPNIDDKELRQLFLHSANIQGCKITEARVMKNLKQVDSEGKSPSKGFGFVTFTEHEHALAALRHLNNNPDIFTAKKRPIVEFSIENKTVLNAKIRKQEQNNKKRPANETTKGEISNEPPSKRFRNKNNKQSTNNSGNVKEETKENYTGFISNKDIKTLPTHVGPKVRKRKNKKGGKDNTNKKMENPSAAVQVKNTRETDNSAEPKKKSKRNRNKNTSKNEKLELQDEKAFQNLVSKYRKTMVEGRRQTKGKWFEEDG